MFNSSCCPKFRRRGAFLCGYHIDGGNIHFTPQKNDFLEAAISTEINDTLDLFKNLPKSKMRQYSLTNGQTDERTNGKTSENIKDKRECKQT